MFRAKRRLTYILCAIGVVVLVITDGIDGALASLLERITTYGKTMDRMADKVLVLSQMLQQAIELRRQHKLHWWLVPGIIVLASVELELMRVELQVSAIVRRERDLKPVGSGVWGKTKFIVQIAALLRIRPERSDLQVMRLGVLIYSANYLAYRSLKDHYAERDKLQAINRQRQCDRSNNGINAAGLQA